jgi:hypothetical protein
MYRSRRFILSPFLESLGSPEQRVALPQVTPLGAEIGIHVGSLIIHLGCQQLLNNNN